jgi:dienelactone hydrolase
MLRTCLLIVALTLPATGQAQGLGNAAKTFTAAAEMTPADWSDPAEMARAWDAALVRVPGADGGFTVSTTAALAAGGKPPAGGWPTIIYLHGCSGVWEGTLRRVGFFAANGFLVIAPASMARAKYPMSCDPVARTAGLYRDTLKMRQFDAGYAIEMARKLPQVDPDNIFLVGLSQGGITTATFAPSGPAQKLRARVVEGWTCHAGWREYAGVNAPDDEPVLTLVGEMDPWFQNDWTRGDCGRYLDPGNGSRSVVYRDEPLTATHELLDFPEPRREVLDFLDARMKR